MRLGRSDSILGLITRDSGHMVQCIRKMSQSKQVRRALIKTVCALSSQSDAGVWDSRDCSIETNQVFEEHKHKVKKRVYAKVAKFETLLNQFDPVEQADEVGH